MTYKPFAILALLVTAAACTITTTRSKLPVFAGPTDSLRERLNMLVACEKFSVDGQEVTTNGKKKSTLEIDVVNGKNVPDDDKTMQALAREIGSDVKEALKDMGEYDEYKVVFERVTVNGSLTNTQSRSVTFQSAKP